MVAVILFILLFIKTSGPDRNNEYILKLVNILLFINLIVGFFGYREGVLFNEMFKTNQLIVTEKNILSLGTFIIGLQSYPWLKDHKQVLEFYLLLLSTLLGMFFMISAGNLLMFYLGLELSSIPLAALANFDLEKKKSGEAAFKFIVSAAFSSGLLLFGISLIYGTTGTLILSALPEHLNGSPLQIFAFILLISGFGFKISAVPFHLWTADVYEGSPVTVTSYFSVVSKGSVLFVFGTVLYTAFKPYAVTWNHILFVLSVMTMVIGNLFAIRQNNLKRFLAFSSVSQVGFILIGMSGASQAGTASVVYFILIYTFSNLGAFGVISLVSAFAGRENMEDYKAFYKTNPALSWVLAVSLFSLAGIPPTAGFFGKFFLLMAGAGHGNYLLITIAVLNMVVSLYYYLKIIKAIFMDTNENPIKKLLTPPSPKLALIICTTGIILTGFIGYIYEYIFSISTVF
ncbi:MAG TPA: NADH-quinone oxidoreductase subunit N [Puia sp.]